MSGVIRADAVKNPEGLHMVKLDMDGIIYMLTPADAVGICKILLNEINVCLHHEAAELVEPKPDV
jgi:hypothetical protein